MATTFPAVLAGELRRDGGRPLVTWYDDASGERVELSVATYATWVAKTSALLVDELGVERGALVWVDLPTHWLGPVWLGAAWTVGAAVSDDPGLRGDAALVVCGPGPLVAHAVGPAPVMALSLRPMAARFDQPLPAGVVDYGAVVWGQPDVFSPLDPPGPGDAAWRDARGERSQADLLVTPARGRTLTDVNPCSARGTGHLAGPALQGGGVVWVAHPSPDRWDRHAAAERVTAQVRA